MPAMASKCGSISPRRAVAKYLAAVSAQSTFVSVRGRDPSTVDLPAISGHSLTIGEAGRVGARSILDEALLGVVKDRRAVIRGSES